MKIHLHLPFIGFSLALLIGGAGAQNVSAPFDSPKSKNADNMANPQLFALRDQLSELVLAKYPDATVGFLDDALVIRRRSAKFETHLFTPFDDTFPTDGIRFPANYDEFVIRVAIQNGVIEAELKRNSGAKEKAYGTSESSVYPWKAKRVKDSDAEFKDIPEGSWVYPALRRLSDAGLIESLNHASVTAMESRPFTSYEVMVALARALDREPYSQKLATAPQKSKEDFANLRMAFPIEIIVYLGRRSSIENRRPTGKEIDQPQLLWLAFAYGKGVDAKFVAGVKQTVADYAAQNPLTN